MSTDIAIKSMNVIGEVVDVGAAAAKSMPHGVRHRYFVDVIYGCDDALTIKCSIRGMTKPKLQMRIKDTLLDIEKGRMYAIRTYDDREWMVMLSMSINLR